MPPIPKHPSVRQRTNKVAGARTLSVVRPDDAPPISVPPLPARGEGEEWHSRTIAWWRDLWASPMAPEYDESDVHGLYLLAALMDEFWYSPSTSLAAEIRLQRTCFGLTPIDRRRLQWEIDRGEAAADSAEKRRRAREPRPAADPGETDGRAVLGS
jgi:hypothetical protein